MLLRVRKGKKYEVQLEGGKKYKMDKLLWDAMAASAITITMEDFFSTFLKKLSENIKNLLVHYMLGDSFMWLCGCFILYIT